MPKRQTIIATGWGATTSQLARDRKSILLRTPANPVLNLADAQILAEGMLRLIEEAKNVKPSPRT